MNEKKIFKLFILTAIMLGVLLTMSAINRLSIKILSNQIITLTECIDELVEINKIQDKEILELKLKEKEREKSINKQ